VRGYPCAVTDGWVLIDFGQPVPARSLRELLVAHARTGDDAG
jgi:hypothetical protein